MKLSHAAVIAMSLATLSGAASAQLSILVGGPSTAIYATKPGGNAFTAVSACTGQIDSMIRWDNYLIAGALGGGIYRFQLGGMNPVSLVGSFDLPGTASCLAMDGDTLLVGDAVTKTIRRVNPVTGDILASFQLPNGFPPSVDAMVVHNGKLYVGGQSTIVYKGNPDGTNMQFLTACGGKVDSMAVCDDALFLGTTAKNLYRIDLNTGAYHNVFQLPAAQTALLADADGTLLAASEDGIVRRVNPDTGVVLETFPSNSDDIQAMSSFEGNVFCAADVDNDGVPSIDDFVTFQTLFAIGDLAADFDQNGELSVDDFIAFQNTFAFGCPA